MRVAQLWCPKCRDEVIARLHDDASGEKRTARCPWCDTTLDVPEEAVDSRCQPSDGQSGTRLKDSAASVGSAAKAGRSARRSAAQSSPTSEAPA